MQLTKFEEQLKEYYYTNFTGKYYYYFTYGFSITIEVADGYAIINLNSVKENVLPSQLVYMGKISHIPESGIEPHDMIFPIICKKYPLGENILNDSKARKNLSITTLRELCNSADEITSDYYSTTIHYSFQLPELLSIWNINYSSSATIDVVYDNMPYGTKKVVLSYQCGTNKVYTDIPLSDIPIDSGLDYMINTLIESGRVATPVYRCDLADYNSAIMSVLSVFMRKYTIENILTDLS